MLDSVLRAGDNNVFAVWLSTFDDYDVRTLKLGNKAEANWECAVELTKPLDRYAYGARIQSPRSTRPARRASRSNSSAAHRSWLTASFIASWSSRRSHVASQSSSRRSSSATPSARSRGRAPATARPTRLRTPRRRQRRELADQAHGANLDLGSELLKGLSVVRPDDISVAGFFVYAVLGSDWSVASIYGNAGERVHDLAMRGIRLVIDDFRADVTKTLKSGMRGRLRIAYGDPR